MWAGAHLHFPSPLPPMASNSNKKTTYNKTPSIKPKKPSWIRSCFVFGSSHKTRPKPDRSTLDEATTAGARRFKGLGILRGVVKRPWAKKRDKTTSFKATKGREKVNEEGRRRSVAIEVVEGSTTSKVVVVVGKNQKSLLVDDEFHEAEWPIKGHIKKEFDCAKDPPTCQNLSKSTEEDTSITHKIKVKKADSKKHAKPEEQPNLARVSSNRSRRQSTKRSNIDDTIGLSILVTILVIMLLFGRLCAILCTAIWLYCMPRLTKTTKNNKNNAEGNNSSSVRLESQRKEVVLKGFLERKHISFAKVS